MSRNLSQLYEPGGTCTPIYGTFPTKTNPCFMNKGKTEEERNLVTFKNTPMNNYINGELTTKPFLWCGCWVDRLSSKITKLRPPPILPLYPKQVRGHLKQELDFTVLLCLWNLTWACFLGVKLVRCFQRWNNTALLKKMLAAAPVGSSIELHWNDGFESKVHLKFQCYFSFPHLWDSLSTEWVWFRVWKFKRREGGVNRDHKAALVALMPAACVAGS